jgi:L-alanine-DL-glutamate epimerase-like enolase superfamily enzyme
MTQIKNNTPVMNGRRNFIKRSLEGIGGIVMAGLFEENSFAATKPAPPVNKKIKITLTDSNFEREPLLQPFGFKGGYLSELWQTVSYLKSESGLHSIGLGTQSVLWSDASVFSSHSEPGGNALMYALTEQALQLLKNVTFQSPVDLIDRLYADIYEYGKAVTRLPDLRKTFALNALVSVDNALWLLYARENGIRNFDGLIPQEFRLTFSERHEKLAAIPLISYNVKPAEIKKEADAGYFFMKIKIGQSGTQAEMLEKDKQRLYEIHTVLKDIRTPYTHNGKLPYYFDANGRYESKDTFNRFLDYAVKIGAFDRIVLVEEPFPEKEEMDVSDIPVRLAADESAHTDKDTVERIQMGYKAVALKPIAKTLSMTMKIAKAATDRNIPCFCADLTVNPVLVEWNKNIAARLKSFPGLDHLGLVESNGHQNYVNWDAMGKYFPQHDASWVKVNSGFYSTGEDYYEQGGGIFDPVPHYEKMFTNK